MADIENEPKKKKSKKSKALEAAADKAIDTTLGINDSATGAETGSDTDSDTDSFQASSLKDFVANAKNALGGLLDEEPSEEASESMSASEATEQEVTDQTEVAADSIEWNADAADLSIEDTALPMEMSEEVISGDEVTDQEIALEMMSEEAEGGLAAQLAALTAENEANEAAQAEGLAASASADALELTDADLEEASDERSDRLKELARRVAQTVSERKGELSAAGETIAEDFTLTEGAEPPLPDMEQMGFQALEEELEAAENDADPEPTEFVDNDQVISIIESMLFSTDKPVSVATIKAIFKGTNVRTKDIQRALDILASEYASPTRGVSLEEINGGYQLRTKVDNANFLKRLAKSRPFRLSGPALEVMAIVAYKQPVAKFEIDEIRGVESGHLLRALMERGMVSFQGKSETLPGKPMTYGSTRKFLETFGLRNLRELPTLSEIDELLPEGIGEVEEKEKLSDITESLSNDFTGGYSENEDELSKINETLQAIDTTSEFFEQEKVRERERRDRDRAQDLREKLMLGDDVDEKDKRWLDRYEAKLVAQEAAAQAGATSTIPADEIAAEKEIGSDLEALSTEAREEGAEAAASTEGDQAELDSLDKSLEASVNEAGDWSADDLASDDDDLEDELGEDLVSNIEDDFDTDDEGSGSGNA